MNDLRVCMSSGYSMSGNGNFEAEALVYTFGGQVLARFIGGGSQAREIAQRKAEAWLAADEKERRKMERAELTLKPAARWVFWYRRGVVGADQA